MAVSVGNKVPPSKLNKPIKSKHSTKSEGSAKADMMNKDIDCEFSMRQIPLSPIKVDRMIEDLKTWLDRNLDPDGIHDFYYSHDISRSTWERLLKKYPLLAQEAERVKRIIGWRWMGEARKKKGDFAATRFVIQHFGDEFKEMKEYEASLRKTEEADKSPIRYVVLDKMPETDIVPELKKD